MLRMHELALERYGGTTGVRDAGGLDSAVHQPMASFGGEDLYPTVFDNAAALGYSLIRNHPFVDGNKRVGLMALSLDPWSGILTLNQESQIDQVGHGTHVAGISSNLGCRCTGTHLGRRKASGSPAVQLRAWPAPCTRRS